MAIIRAAWAVPAGPLMSMAARSATMIVGMCVFAEGILGITDASYAKAVYAVDTASRVHHGSC